MNAEQVNSIDEQDLTDKKLLNFNGPDDDFDDDFDDDLEIDDLESIDGFDDDFDDDDF